MSFSNILQKQAPAGRWAHTKRDIVAFWGRRSSMSLSSVSFFATQNKPPTIKSPVELLGNWSSGSKVTIPVSSNFSISPVSSSRGTRWQALTTSPHKASGSRKDSKSATTRARSGGSKATGSTKPACSGTATRPAWTGKATQACAFTKAAIRPPYASIQAASCTDCSKSFLLPVQLRTPFRRSSAANSTTSPSSSSANFLTSSRHR